MGRECSVCGKGRTFGKKVSFSKRNSPRSWAPNLRKVRVVEDGTPKRILICTSCLSRQNLDR